MKYELIDVPNSRIEEVIDNYVHVEKHRALLKRRFIDGICFEPLSEEFGLSVIQTQRIVYRYTSIIYKHLRA